MTSTTHELLAAFGGVEDDQRYTRLVQNFADDAVYYDPFFGPQVGIQAIHEFMQHMEEIVPSSGVRFEDWTVDAGTDCGHAQWVMIAKNAAGHEVTVPGESLYRLRAGKVLGVVDYIDPVAYSRLRGDEARTPDFLAGNGSLPEASTPHGPAAADLARHVEAMTYAGRWAGSATLVDHAGEDHVGWAQWVFDGPHGAFSGWSLRRSNGAIRDLFDTVAANDLFTAAS